MSIESNIIEFRKAFGLPINSKPSLLKMEDMDLHVSLIEEEFGELYDAFLEGNITEVFDGIVDLIYVTAGLAVHMGLPLDEGWRTVHSSNMSKLDVNGEPVYSDGTDGLPKGKVLKSSLFTPPRLDVLIEQAQERVEGGQWGGS